MMALYLDEKPKLVEDYPMPRPGPGESLIKVTLAGICSTDLHLIKGYMAFKGILGHEFVGVVEESQDSELMGKRVVGEINCGCMKCAWCQRGLSRHCPERTVLGIKDRDGSFAQYLLLPDQNLHPLPGEVEDDEAVFVEPLAAAFEIIKQVHIKPSDRVVVMGDGKLGLLACQVLRQTTSDVLLMGKHWENLALAKGWGIETLIKDERQPEGDADIVVECTGSKRGLAEALNLVKPGGKIVLKTTTAQADPTLSLNPLVVNEVSLIGSRCGPFPPAIKALKDKKVTVKPLISKVFPLKEGLDAIRYASTKGTLKALMKA